MPSLLDRSGHQALSTQGPLGARAKATKFRIVANDGMRQTRLPHRGKHRLFDHLVDAREHARRHFEAKRSGGLEVHV
jgi:hypothetical protein